MKIRCPQCNEWRTIEDVLAGEEWVSPPCWNCGHEVPPRPSENDGSGADGTMGT